MLLDAILYFPRILPQSLSRLLGVQLFGLSLFLSLLVVLVTWSSLSEPAPFIIPVSEIYQAKMPDRDGYRTYAIVPEGHEHYSARFIDPDTAYPESVRQGIITGICSLIPAGSDDFCIMLDGGHAQVPLTRYALILGNNKTSLVGIAVGTDPDSPRTINVGQVVVVFVALALIINLIQFFLISFLRHREKEVRSVVVTGLLFVTLAIERVVLSIPSVLILLAVAGVTDIYTQVYWVSWHMALQLARFLMMHVTDARLGSPRGVLMAYRFHLKMIHTTLGIFTPVFLASAGVFSGSLVAMSLNWGYRELPDPRPFSGVFYSGLSVYSILLVCLYTMLTYYADVVVQVLYHRRAVQDIEDMMGGTPPPLPPSTKNPLNERITISGIFVARVFYLLGDTALFLFFTLYYSQRRFVTL